jgi:hypothetical protein
MKIKLTTSLKDSKRTVTPECDIEFSDNFIPRIGDTIVWNNDYWEVKHVVIDNAYKEIRLYLKDSEFFK